MGVGGNTTTRITGGGALSKSPASVVDASAGPAGKDSTLEIYRADSDVVESTLVLSESFLNVFSMLSH